MELGRKNLLYSLILAGMMMLFLIGYFIYMLPSLYVDHIMEQNLKSLREQHKAYTENHSYEEVQVRNFTACYSLEIPKEGNRILIAGKAFSAEVIIKDDRLGRILDRCRKKIAEWELSSGEERADAERDGTSEDNGDRALEEKGEKREKWLEEEMEELAHILREAAEEQREVLPVELNLLYRQELEGAYFDERVKYHYYSDGVIIMEFSISDENNHYTTYIAAEETEDSFIMSCLPVVTPGMEEIRPIVLQSLPMLGAVILLLVLLFSQMYSKGIVYPVVELVHHAEAMKAAVDFSVPRLYGQEKEESGASFFRKKGTVSLATGFAEGKTGKNLWGKRALRRHPGRKDEIRQLADTLDDFYGQIGEGYQKLEEENRRQEIFLRASSHQLKTPIAAALLLTEGMISEVGRYKDTGRYLPKVKEQLLSMRKIVEDILYLNHCADNLQTMQIKPGRLLEDRLGIYQAVLTEKRLRADYEGDDELTVYSDETVLLQILDNLLSNAVKYTPEGERICITLHRRKEEKNSQGQSPVRKAGQTVPEAGAEIRIENFGVTIPEELLPHIFEPFVSGSHGAGAAGISSHGLGLYIAAWYAHKLGLLLTVYNGENSVVARLRF